MKTAHYTSPTFEVVEIEIESTLCESVSTSTNSLPTFIDGGNVC